MRLSGLELAVLLVFIVARLSDGLARNLMGEYEDPGIGIGSVVRLWMCQSWLLRTHAARQFGIDAFVCTG